MSTPYKNVLVISAGNIGRAAIEALLEEKFNVTVLTSESSSSVIPNGVTHVRTDYSKASLRQAFKNQDAVISTISGSGLALQKMFVDVAIAADVQRFFPSEYGIDTSSPISPVIVPMVASKVELLDYLKTQQDRLSWTAICSAHLFDWSLAIPSFGGIDTVKRTATLFDGGKTPFESTSVKQVGKAIALAVKASEQTRNEYVYVNSLTTTQESILSALESISGEKYTVAHSSVDRLRNDGQETWRNGDFDGMLALISSAFYGNFGVANWAGKLWNEKLGLEGENLEDLVRDHLRSQCA